MSFADRNHRLASASFLDAGLSSLLLVSVKLRADHVRIPWLGNWCILLASSGPIEETNWELGNPEPLCSESASNICLPGEQNISVLCPCNMPLAFTVQGHYPEVCLLCLPMWPDPIPRPDQRQHEIVTISDLEMRHLDFSGSLFLQFCVLLAVKALASLSSPLLPHLIPIHREELLRFWASL